MAFSKSYAGVTQAAGGSSVASGTSASYDSTGFTHVVVGVKHEGGTTTITPSDNKSTVWEPGLTKEVVSASSGGTDLNGQFFFGKIGSPGSGHQVTVSVAANRPWFTFGVWFVNCDTGAMTAVSETTAEGASGTTVDAGTLTNSSGESVVSFMVMLEYSGVTHTGSSGWTEDYDLAGAGAGNYTAGYSRGPETTNPVDPAGTQSGSAVWGCIAAMFRDGTGGGGGPTGPPPGTLMQMGMGV